MAEPLGLEDLVRAVRFAVTRYGMSHVVLTPTVEMAPHIAGNMMNAWRVSFRADAPTRTLELHWPKTWWDHLKHDWAPDWFIRRWPIEYVDYQLREILANWALKPGQHEVELLYKEEGSALRTVDPTRRTLRSPRRR